MSALAELAALIRKRLASTGQEELVRAGAETADGKLLTRNFNEDEIDRIGRSELIMRRKVLSDLLGPDRRLKSVHETNRTAAAVGPKRSIEVRSRYEPQMFGEKGQTYGYLTNEPYGPMKGPLSVEYPKTGPSRGLAPKSILPMYGQYGVKLTPEAKNAATFTLADSLDSSRSHYPTANGLLEQGGYHQLTMPGSRLHDLALQHQSERERARGLLTEDQRAYGENDYIEELLRSEGKPASMLELLKQYGLDKGLFKDPPTPYGQYMQLPRIIPRQVSDPRAVPLSPAEMNQLDKGELAQLMSGDNWLSYIEAQMHGPVTPELIEKVYDFNYEPSSEIERKLRKIGVAYEPRPEDNVYNLIKKYRPETMGELSDILGPERFPKYKYYNEGPNADEPAIPMIRGFKHGGGV